jgi:hypothetical protein
MLRVVTDTDNGELLNGSDVLREIGELIAERLPSVPLDDPNRIALQALVLASGAGRSAR